MIFFFEKRKNFKWRKIFVCEFYVVYYFVWTVDVGEINVFVGRWIGKNEIPIDVVVHVVNVVAGEFGMDDDEEREK